MEKGGALLLNKLDSLHKRMIYAKFGWNWPSGSAEEDENVKSLRQRGRLLQRGRQLTNFDQKSSLELIIYMFMQNKKFNKYP